MKTRRRAGSLPPSKPPPARHRPGARSARRQRCPTIVSQTAHKKEPVMFTPFSNRTDGRRLRAAKVRRRPTYRPGMESLEDRCLLSGDVVLHWNEVLLQSLSSQPPRVPLSRNMALVHV